jgi:DnaJ-class molecular chaperone
MITKEIKKCDYCNGTGKVKYMTLPVACPKCSGKGKVTN